MKLGKLETVAVLGFLVAAVGQLFLIVGGWFAAMNAGAGLAIELANLSVEPRAVHSLLFTIGVVAASLSVQVLIAVPIALLIALGRTALRSFPLFAPALIAPSTFGMAAYLLLSPGLSPIAGLSAVSAKGLGELFVNPKLMFLTVVAVDSWQWVPPLTAALVIWGIRPAQPHIEVLRTEGARGYDYVRHALTPSMAPVLAAYAAIRAFDLLRLHDLVASLFGAGGPGYAAETFSMYVTKISFQRGRESEAALLSFAYMMAIVITFSVVIRGRRVASLLPWNSGSL